MTLIFSFLGFLASRLPFCWPLAISISFGFDNDAGIKCRFETPATFRLESELGSSPDIIRPKETARVQIKSGLEHGDEFKRATAINAISLRIRPTDARGPPIGIVEHE